MTEKQCERCGEVNPAEIHTCSPQEPLWIRNKEGKLELHAPPQREWQGLTDEDCEEVERWVEFKEEGSGRIPTRKLILYIEAKLKAKNI